MEDDLDSLQMEDLSFFVKMEDNLNLFNKRRPQYFWGKWKATSMLYKDYKSDLASHSGTAQPQLVP